jgi:long-chain acyl-CoA synthetase
MAEINRQLEKQGISSKSEAGYVKALELLKNEVDQYKKGGKYENMFPERWLPACMLVLPEAFTEQNHMMNSTMKIVRGKITERFSKEIDFLYTPEAKNIVNPMNIASMKKWSNS